jgi:hypothetical protein
VRICIAAQWLIPAAITMPGAFFGLCDYTFYMVPDDGMINGTNYTGLLPFPVILSQENAMAVWTTNLYSDLTIIFWTVTAILVLVIYLRLFRKMRTILRNNNVGATQQQQQQRTAQSFSLEMRLLAYGVILVVIQGSGAILQILLKYFGFNTWYLPTAAIMDYNCYIHPYFLLAFSAPLRNRCFVLLRIRKTQQGVRINVQSLKNTVPT